MTDPAKDYCDHKFNWESRYSERDRRLEAMGISAAGKKHKADAVVDDCGGGGETTDGARVIRKKPAAREPDPDIVEDLGGDAANPDLDNDHADDDDDEADRAATAEASSEALLRGGICNRPLRLPDWPPSSIHTMC